MKLYIKHMVSLRCKMLVENELEKLGLHCLFLDLGVAEIKEDISTEKKKSLKKTCANQG